MDERDHLARLNDRVWHIPTPTTQQYAAAERYVRRNAPDLLAMLGLDEEAA